jgi:PKD repeat protein
MKVMSIKIAKCFLMLLLLTLMPECQKVPFYAGDGAILIISADRSQLKTKGDKAIITVIGFTKDGEALHDYTTVIFTATLGVIAGSVQLLQGRASVEFVSGDANGTAEITARSGNIVATPAPLNILIGSGVVETMTIQANPAQLGAGGGRSLISVYAFDKAMKPLADIPIILSTTYGVLDHGNNVHLTDTNGMVSDYLSTEKTAKVTAESGGKNVFIEVKVEDNQLPIADFTISPNSAKINETVLFDGSLSSDPDGSIVSWEWNFGDGSLGNGERTSHIYLKAGTFTVTLKIIDNSGGSKFTQKTIVISSQNQLPIAVFSISPTEQQVENKVFFDASLSSDPDGTIVKWEWKFGDGDTANGPEPEHVYHAANTYTVILKVTDNSGGSTSSQKTIKISE